MWVPDLRQEPPFCEFHCAVASTGANEVATSKLMFRNIMIVQRYETLLGTVIRKEGLQLCHWDLILIVLHKNVGSIV
jgi:hypothetical protein